MVVFPARNSVQANLSAEHFVKSSMFFCSLTGLWRLHTEELLIVGKVERQLAARAGATIMGAEGAPLLAPGGWLLGRNCRLLRGRIWGRLRGFRCYRGRCRLLYRRCSCLRLGVSGGS